MSNARKKNPNEGFSNPFFRDQEKSFHSGEKEVYSVVGSVWDAVPVRNTNAMEDQLSETKHAARGTSFGGKKGGKK